MALKPCSRVSRVRPVVNRFNAITSRGHLTCVPAQRLELCIPEEEGFTGPLHTPVADRLGTGGRDRTYG